ncbi:uncharacterized protein [Amphiura filiformis]|uniref:uncharacterized protein isoform X2 n=1 Tax=Amphiura filiformis TaxID=82378 RepID=UPI003B219428
MAERTRRCMFPCDCVMGLLLSLRTTQWLPVLIVCLVCMFCTVNGDLNRFQRGIADHGPPDDLAQKYPNLNRRGLLPGLLSNNKAKNNAPRRLRQPRDQIGRGLDRQQRDAGGRGPPKEDERKKLARPDKPKPRAPQEQPKMRYDKVMTRTSEETSYRFPENQRVYFTCPKDSFIAEISYKFDTVTSQLVRPWTWGSGTGGLYSIRHKVSKGLTPERVTPIFLRQPIINNNNKKQEFLDMVNPPVAQSPLTETGCDPALYCLGHQRRAFLKSLWTFANDPAEEKRKMFYISVRCARDSALHTYIYNAEAVTKVQKEMDQVLYMTLDEEKTTKEFTQLNLKTFDESEIFGVTCPPAREALRHGYGGVCTLEPPSQMSVANDLWNVLGRVPTKVCRDELYQAYCAYHYNTSGGCVPPALIQTPKDSQGWKPGELVFSAQAMPQVGNRPDTSEFESRLSDPHIGLIPATIGFLILSHDHPDAVMQLLQGIYRPYHFYAIHVDFRQDIVREDIKDRIKRLYGSADNVHVIPKDRSFVASWGSYYILRAELECFEELLRMGVWDFAINLSGADMPIRDVDDVSAALASARGYNFMRQNGNWNDRDDRPTDYATWYGCGAHVYNVSIRGKRPAWSDMHSTSQWGVFSRDFIELMISPDRPEKMKVLQFFAMTCIIPDESFLASMIKVSPMRNTFIHGNMHFLKQFDRRDDRGFCRHTEDIDFCGQGPGKFEPGDMDTILLQANNLAFARKFDGDVTSPVRLYALEIAAGKYYEELRHKHITEEMLRQMVSLALEAEYGESWETEAYVEDLLKLRVVPQMLPLDPCCMPVYNTKNQLVHDVRYWLDFSVVESKTGERRILRTSLVHQSRTKCFSRGHIKALYITSKQGTQGKRTQVPPIQPIPTEPAGGSVLYLTSYINLSDKIPEAPECNEVEGIPDDSYEGRSPDSFNFASYKLKTPEKEPLRFNATLISPTGDVKCFIEVVIAYKKPPPSLQKVQSSTQLMTRRLDCGPRLEPGLYTVVLFQLNVKDPFPYTAQVFLTKKPDRSQRWNLHAGEEQANKKKPGDVLYGLWTVEEIRELPDEEIKRYNYLKDGAVLGDGQVKPFFKENAGLNENEDENSANANAQEEEDGNDNNEDEDESSDDEKDKNRPGMRPAQGGVVEKQPPKFGGEAPGGQAGANNEIIRGRRGEQGPIEGLRHLKGQNDASLQFFPVEKNGTWKKQTLYVTLLEFFGISAIIFLFIKGVLVPLRIVKRGSSGFKSFGLFVVVVTLLQFLVYTLFSISTAS